MWRWPKRNQSVARIALISEARRGASVFVCCNSVSCAGKNVGLVGVRALSDVLRRHTALASVDLSGKRGAWLLFSDLDATLTAVLEQ